MEELKSLIPSDLKRMIGESTAENLPHSCSTLLEFLVHLPQFQQVIGDLTDPELALCRKRKEKALDFKQKGNECFTTGDYAKALNFYSKALRYSPMTDDAIDERFVATLYVNRASSTHTEMNIGLGMSITGFIFWTLILYLSIAVATSAFPLLWHQYLGYHSPKMLLQKMNLLEECIRDCNRAIVLSPGYAKAWYRRGKANASLKNYGAAIHDLEVSLSLEGSLSGKKQIKEEITVMLKHVNATPGKAHSIDNRLQKKFGNPAEQCDIKLQCVATPLKGRGMVSPADIPPALLLHSEEPLAAIVMKSCRETYCHFCFNELPADVFFCLSCTIPIYCSQHCLEQATGDQFLRNQNLFSVQKNLSAELTKYIMDTTMSSHEECDVTDASFAHIHEHRHECGGVNWPSVLPVDVVLAGRVMVKFIAKGKFSGVVSKSIETLEFTHNYNETPPQNKLELHIYAIVLSHCLQRDYGLDVPSVCCLSSKLVLLISQIKVNSMAIVRMKSPDRYEEFEKSPTFSGDEKAFAISVEQIQVGKALYATGSLFNHSCLPNIHAYFFSRTLFLRSTEFVPAWVPLELSYGPQVGELSFHERQKLLKECYSFKCQCRGCLELNLSDIVIGALCCSEPHCLGAVLDIYHHRKLEEAFLPVPSASFSCMNSLVKEDIGKVAYLLLQRSDIGPKHCLTCGAYRDVESLRGPSESAMRDIQRFKDCTSSKATGVSVLDSQKSLGRLRSARHRYSKAVAQAEDTIAEAFVMVGEFNLAMLHCRASIEILEKLYNPNHIVIGHELLKLVSIQLSSGDRASALCNIKRLRAIFSIYYGSHATTLFSYLDELRGQAEGRTT